MLEFLLVHGFAEFGQRGHGIHEDGSAAFLHLEQHQMVTQAGRGNGRGAVRRVAFQFGLGGIAAGKGFAQAIEGLGLEQQEPGAHRAVTVFEAGRGETVFHHGQFGTHLHAHGIGGTGVPDRVPGAAFAFTHRTGLVDVHGAAAGHHHGFAFDDVNFVFADRETHGAGDLVFDIGIQQQLDDEATLDDVVFAQGQLGGFRYDAFVGLTVDHDLPFTGADRLGAGFQGAHGLAFFTVQVFPLFGFFPDRQTPFFEQVDRVIDMAAEAVNQVFAHYTHQVVAHHADIVFHRVFTDKGIDGGKPLGHSAGAFHGGFVAQQDGLVVAQPFFNFKRGTAGCHTAAYDQNVDFTLLDFRIPYRLEFTQWLIR